MMSNPEGHDCPDCFISFHASVLPIEKKKKEDRERGQGPKRVAGEKELPLLLSTNLGSSGHVPVCVLGLFHIPLALLELNCLVRGPISPPQSRELSKCKLKCVCFSVESQNDLSLLNGISYMCWVR